MNPVIQLSRGASQRAGWLYCIAVLLSFPMGAMAQTQSAQTITAVDFEGLTRTSTVFVENVVKVKVGDPLDTRALDDAVTRLLRTGRFLAASHAVDEQAGGVRVTFKLHERPVVSSIRIDGNSKFNVSNLKGVVGISEGDPIDWFTVRDGRDTITTKYREAGYGDVAVTFDREQIEQTGALVYRVEEGPRIRIREIVFEGTTAFSDRQLKKEIETKTALWVLRAGVVDEARLESDIVQLRSYYRDRGFLDANVSYRRETLDKPGDLRVVFSVVEGVRYAIEKIGFSGNAVFSGEELADLMQSQVEGNVNRTRIDQDVRAVRSSYWEQGYIYASVRAASVFSDRPGFIRLTIEIDEGDQFRVGKVVVRGNTRTKDKVVRRELNLYPPDDLLDLTAAKEAERRLLETRIFDSARVMPVGDQPGVRDVVIDVQEAEKSGDFLFGFGVTSNSGLVGNIILDLQNFDLFDTPRSLSELIKFRSFFGGGQRLRLELQPGTDVSRFRMDFTEPYLFDKPVRLDVSTYLFERGRDGYSERRGGFGTSIGKRFERGRLQGWSGELAMRIDVVNVDDVDLFAARDIRQERGSQLLTSVKATMARDHTDSRFLPSTGNRFRIGYEQFGVFGGENTFGKLTARYQWYSTLKTDIMERKSVLQLKAVGGAVLGHAPVFERFYAGGTGSIRGFEFRGVGPREGIDDNIVGGDFLVLLGAEYSYPLFGDNIRGHVFIDSGTVDSDTYRVSIGTGVRLTIQMLGPLPLEFNFAAPVLSDGDDDEQFFSFLIGSLF